VARGEDGSNRSSRTRRSSHGSDPTHDPADAVRGGAAGPVRLHPLDQRGGPRRGERGVPAPPPARGRPGRPDVGAGAPAAGQPGLTKAVGGPFDRGSDPTVTFGIDHVVYASTIDFSFRQTCPSAVGVQWSTDGGVTWSDPVFPENDDTCDVFNDKNWLVADTN